MTPPEAEQVAAIADQLVAALPGVGPHMVLAAIRLQLALEAGRGCNLTAEEVHALDLFMSDGDWWNEIRVSPRLAVRSHLLAQEKQS